MMKFLLVLCLVNIILALESSPKTKLQFQEFIAKYDRHYASHEEYEYRYSNFLANLEKANKMNQGNAKYGITKFSDYSEQEIRNMKMEPTSPGMLIQSCLAANVSAAETLFRNTSNIPTAFDWRSKNVVTPVKNQGQCGSCWTFSTTGNIESQYAIAENKMVELSEQMIVDCSHSCVEEDGQSVCNQGCGGGWMWTAMADVIGWGGLETESAYPYTAETGKCQFSNTSTTEQLFAPIKNYTCIGEDENQILLNLLSRGPLSIAMNADLLESYESGIIDPSAWWDDDDGCDPSTLDHALLLVGYGVQEGWVENTPFWTIKNSWGADWGEEGYFRIVRGYGACGMNEAVTCAALESSQLLNSNE